MDTSAVRKPKGVPCLVAFACLASPHRQAFLCSRAWSHGYPNCSSERVEAVSDAGISSHERPSSSRPPAFGVRPPHCLWKNATPASLLRSRRDRTQSGSHGRKPAPLSPPVISQSMLVRSSRSSGPISGSALMNLTSVGTFLKWFARQTYRFVSTETPAQICGRHGSVCPNRAILPLRLVNTWKTCQSACTITSNTRRT